RWPRDWSSDVCSSDLILARLLGESPRIESLAFSTNGAMLAVAGSAPARFGEIQIWDVTAKGFAKPAEALLKAYKIAPDSIYGIRSEERRVGKECRSRW